MKAKNTASSTMAIRKWVIGPAPITAARCHTGLDPKARGTSSSGVSSKGFIPAILT